MIKAFERTRLSVYHLNVGLSSELLVGLAETHSARSAVVLGSLYDWPDPVYA
jgi:hypothetical protein